MRIAQVAPLYERVPPRRYGGTERVVSYLTEELTRLGHEVILFASGDSVTQAKLVAPCQKALLQDEGCEDPLAHHVNMVEMTYQMKGSFDIIHSHINYIPFSLLRRGGTPNVTTLHWRLDIPDLFPLFHEFHELPFVSISNFQRGPMPWLNWRGTVYHGIPDDLYHFRDGPGKYLAFLGRISPEKGVDHAIEIAKRVGMEIKIAARVGTGDRAYFEAVIKPLMKDPLVEYVGEIGDEQKEEFLGNASALLFPIDWPEPFGLVMIEALACGTPIIAYRQGSVPEVIDEGKTGFIVEDLEDAIRAVKQVSSISRKSCRQAFEDRFSASRMGQNYLHIYSKLIEENH